VPRLQWRSCGVCYVQHLHTWHGPSMMRQASWRAQLLAHRTRELCDASCLTSAESRLRTCEPYVGVVATHVVVFCICFGQRRRGCGKRVWLEGTCISPPHTLPPSHPPCLPPYPSQHAYNPHSVQPPLWHSPPYPPPFPPTPLLCSPPPGHGVECG